MHSFYFAFMKGEKKMKRGTKLAALLLSLALIIPACTQKGSSESKPVDQTSQPSDVSSDDQPGTSDEVKYTVTISNKTELQAEWFAGDPSRKVNIEIEPKANITQLVNEGKIQITSSNAEVASVTGQMVNPVAAGKATITVKCGDSQDTVEVTLLAKQTVKEKYGVAHEGTAEDPFTNEDACKVAKSDKYNNEDFYVKGVVDRFYYAPGSRTDGNVAFYLVPAQEGGEQFEVFKCYKDKEQKEKLTDDDIWVGGTVVAHGQFTVYNGTQAETTAAIFVSCEGNKPQPRQTIEKTFAEVLALGVALKDGADSYDYYKFQGYATFKKANDIYLTATKGEALVSGKSDEAHGSRDIYTNAIQLYGVGSNADLAAKLLEGAKVEVTMVVKNYHGTVENGNVLADADVVVKEEGTPWAVPATKATVAQALTVINGLEDGKTTDAQYEITGFITAIDTAWSDSFKNITYKLGDTADATDVLTVYRSGAAEGTTGSELKVGDKVKVVGYLQKYVKNEVMTPELTNGVTTFVSSGEGGGSEETNYGTETEPLTVAQAKAIATAQLGEVNSYTESMLWVKAYVTNVPTVNGTYGWKNINLGDAADAAQADTLLAYSVNKSDTCAKLAQNDFVVIHGALKNYNGTIEFTNVKDGDTTIHGYPTFSGRVAGTSTITLGAHENATVSELPASAKNDTAITFTVTVATGYVLSTVKLNGKTITANEGQYSFELAGNSTIEVNTVAEGTATGPQAGDYALFTNDIVEGDYIIYYNGKAAKATVASNRLGFAELEPTDNFIASALAAKEIVWHISKSGDNWVIKNADANKYMASTGTKNQAALVDSVTDKATWTITKGADGTFEIENVSNKAAGVNSLLRNNGTFGFATYATSTGGALSLFQKKA